MDPENDVHERLVRIETKLDAIIINNKDHEDRIRVLEGRSTVTPKELWTVALGALGGAVGIVQIIAAFAYHSQ